MWEGIQICLYCCPPTITLLILHVLGVPCIWEVPLSKNPLWKSFQQWQLLRHQGFLQSWQWWQWVVSVSPGRGFDIGWTCVLVYDI